MTQSAHGWCLVVPVKRLDRAKTRLSPLAGPRRQDLALAFALDTTEVLVRCELVRQVVAVTDDATAAQALEQLGALVIGDEPDAGLNPALAHGAAVAVGRHPGCGVGAVSADLPALRPAELMDLLSSAVEHSFGFVSDTSGLGSTVLLAAEPARFAPAFGAGSARLHERAGAVLPTAGPSLRRDVDTESDLDAAALLGLGPRTEAVLSLIAPGRFAAAG
jgi:2-phospho-L-lactate/phosphoenolpyruvate guanylyltransferase